VACSHTQLVQTHSSDGIKKAIEKGVQFGAKAKLTPEQVLELKQRRDEGVKIKELMSTFGLSKASVYRLLSGKMQN